MLRLSVQMTTHVQKGCGLQARQDTLRCSMPFLERGLHADSLAAAMTDLEDQSGACMFLLQAEPPVAT